ncbi:glycosyltransferase family 4 protein [Photobacterium damselae]|uniref:glycosyltransferase family 4 protein n=1 Tax=Photobacterium damselae TaxID=38293 RepID=UPI0013029B4C|nr:glycosyltransferase family 4 protein [Photobacterium damselae]
MNDKSKLFITSKFFFPNIGGVENSLKEISKSLSDEYDVYIYTTNINNVSDDSLLLSEEFDGYNIKRIDCNHKNKYIRELLFYIKMIWSLRKEAKKSINSVIIARDHFSVINAWFAGFREISYLVPGVVKYQNNKVNHGAGKSLLFLKIENIIQKISFRLSKRIFVFSKNMMKQVTDVDNKSEVKIYLCKPGVNFNRFKIATFEEKKTLRKKYNIPSDKYIILGLARFVKAKGYENLILSMKYLSDDFYLILVGSGPEYDNYNQIISDENIKNIKIFPPTSTPNEFYKLSDVFAMTSIYEPLGQTILESQVSGLPNLYHLPSKDVITAVDEIIYKEYSFPIKENNPLSISESIVNAKLSTSNILSRKMRASIKEKFSWYKLGVLLTCKEK